MLKKGEEAPELNCQGSDEKTHTLKEHKGKYVILYFYPRDDTPGCTLEAQDFAANKEKFKKENAVIYGISKDSIKSHCDFIKKQNLNFILLSDPNMDVHKKYGAIKEGDKTQRSTILVNPEGKIVHIWPQVSIPGHVEDVLNRLKADKD